MNCPLTLCQQPPPIPLSEALREHSSLQLSPIYSVAKGNLSNTLKSPFQESPKLSIKNYWKMPIEKLYPKMLTSSFTCEIVSFENRWESCFLEYIGRLLKTYVDSSWNRQGFFTWEVSMESSSLERLKGFFTWEVSSFKRSSLESSSFERWEHFVGSFQKRFHLPPSLPSLPPSLHRFGWKGPRGKLPRKKKLGRFPRCFFQAF